VDFEARNKVLILIAQLISVCLSSELVFCQHIVFVFFFIFLFLRSLHEAYKINSQQGGRVYILFYFSILSIIIKITYVSGNSYDAEYVPEPEAICLQG